MNKWFVIIVMDDCSAEHRNSITEHLRSKDHGWWHWVSSTWVVEADQSEKTNELRDEIKSVALDESFIVLEFPSEPDWSGFGPPKMFKWFREEDENNES